MGPKVDAALRFVEGGGRQAAITSLDRVREGVAGTAGTIVRRMTRARDRPPRRLPRLGDADARLARGRGRGRRRRRSRSAMATPLNLELIAGQGFELPADARPERPRDRHPRGRRRGACWPPSSARSPGARAAAAGRRAPRAALAGVGRAPARLSSTSRSCRSPGATSATRRRPRVEAGLHVFCFSDGLGLEQEAALKRRALERGLLFMGADCGTAILDGVALGFANAVRARAGRHRRRVGDGHPGGLLPARRGGRSGSRTRSASAGATCSAEVGGDDVPTRPRAARGRRRDRGDRRDLQAAGPGRGGDDHRSGGADRQAGGAGVPRLRAAAGTLEHGAPPALAQLAGGALPELRGRPRRASPGRHPRPLLRRDAVRRGDGDRVRARRRGGLEHPAAARVAPGVRARRAAATRSWTSATTSSPRAVRTR